MTSIYHNGREYSFKSDDDVEALADLVRRDPRAAEKLDGFNPVGSWCVSDPDGGPDDYLKDSAGHYVTTTMTEDDMTRYHRALGGLRPMALQAVMALQEERAAQQYADDPLRAFDSHGGPQWFDERG